MLALTQLVGFGGGSSLPTLAVTLDGTAQDNSTANNQVYTVVGTIPAGSLVAIMACMATTVSTLSSISDSRGNTYSVEQAGAHANNICAGIGSSYITTALQAGDTITIAWSGSTTGHGCIVAWVNNGQASAGDKTASATGTSTSPSSGATAATTQNNEVAFGVVGANAAAVVTEASGYTNLASLTFAGGGARIDGAYKILTTTGAQTYAPTLGTSQAWSCSVATYKVPG